MYFSHYNEHVKARGEFHDDQCAQCDKRLTCYEEYQMHVKADHFGIWKWKCGHCKLAFDELSELKGHVTEVHGGTWMIRAGKFQRLRLKDFNFR